MEQVDPIVTRGLRNVVLRPGMDADAVHWPDVEGPDAITYAVRDDESTPVSTVTVIPEPCPWRPGEGPAWRVRGMATEDVWRGRGVGRIGLDAAVAHVREAGATLLWCNARDVALRFYERAGFVVEGDGFTSAMGVRHHPMARSLHPSEAPDVHI